MTTNKDIKYMVDNAFNSKCSFYIVVNSDICRKNECSKVAHPGFKITKFILGTISRTRTLIVIQCAQVELN